MFRHTIFTLLFCSFFLSNATAKPAFKNLEQNWEAAWNRVVERNLKKRLQRYKDGTLAKVAAKKRQKALKDIAKTMRHELSWSGMGNEVGSMIATQCDSKTLELLEQFYTDRSKGLDESVRQHYNQCVKVALTNAQGLLFQRMLVVNPKVDDIIRKYNPAHKF